MTRRTTKTRRGNQKITMAQRRRAFEAYLAGGQGSLPLHRFFDRFHARTVTPFRTGLMIHVEGAGFLFMPWDCYDTALATASEAARANYELGEHNGEIYGLHWRELDVDISLSGLVWDASLPQPPAVVNGPRVRTRNVLWTSRLPAAIRSWVAPAMKAVGRQIPEFRPVVNRTLPAPTRAHWGGLEFTEGTGCTWCDLGVEHTHHLDEL